MDNEVKEILMQLVDTTNKLAEGQKQTNERLDKMDNRFNKMDERLDKIENDLDEIKEDLGAAKFTASHNGEILEQMVKDLAPLNMLNVKY